MSSKEFHEHPEIIIPESSDLTRRSFIQTLGVAGAAAVAPMVFTTRKASAANWPTRPITGVVMYAAGGGTDTVIRTLCGEMARSTGWPVNVINRPGSVGGDSHPVRAQQGGGRLHLAGRRELQQVRPADGIRGFGGVGGLAALRGGCFARELVGAARLALQDLQRCGRCGQEEIRQAHHLDFGRGQHLARGGRHRRGRSGHRIALRALQGRKTRNRRGPAGRGGHRRWRRP